MTHNPILNELRQIREDLLKTAGGTVAALVAQLQQDEHSSGRKVLNPADLPRNRRKMNGSESARNTISDDTISPASR